MKVVKYIQGTPGLLDGIDTIIMSSAGNKAKDSASLVVQTHICPVKGFTRGVELWAQEWARSNIGKEFIMESVEAPFANNVGAATSWGGRVANVATVTAALRLVASYPLFCGTMTTVSASA
jgi:hypothetical protein